MHGIQSFAVLNYHGKDHVNMKVKQIDESLQFKQVGVTIIQWDVREGGDQSFQSNRVALLLFNEILER